MLSVVVLAIVLVSAGSAYFDVQRARHQQQEHLRQVVQTVARGAFPLNDRVLRQLSGLTGAKFVLLDYAGRVIDATVSLTPAEQVRVRQVRTDALADQPRVVIGTRTFLGSRATLTGRTAYAANGSIVVLYPEDQWWAVTRQAAGPALVAGAVAVALVVVVTTMLARRFIRPIHRLGEQAAAVAGGNFRPGEVSRRNDEFRDLTLSLNRMAQRLQQVEDEVRRSERLRTLGQLGAGMAHQLRNAATGALLAIELHERDLPAETDRQSLAVAIQQLRLMESYLQRFLALGRPAANAAADCCVGQLVADVLPLVEPACKHAHIALRARVPREPISVCGDAAALRQVLVNLLMNGIEASPRDGRGAVEVIVERCESLARIEVIDNGPGPSEATRQRLFEPFVTEKQEGSGLGLFVARQTVEAHGGTIAWRRRDGTTCFCVELPLNAQPPASPEKHPA